MSYYAIVKRTCTVNICSVIFVIRIPLNYYFFIFAIEITNCVHQLITLLTMNIRVTQTGLRASQPKNGMVKRKTVSEYTILACGMMRNAQILIPSYANFHGRRWVWKGVTIKLKKWNLSLNGLNFLVRNNQRKINKLNNIQWQHKIDTQSLNWQIGLILNYRI